MKEESTIAENKLLKKTKDESVILRMQLEATEKIIKDRLNEMIAIINDTNRISVEDRELVGAHIREVESFMDEQTKSWNKLKIITIDNVDEMEELFSKENELKMIVSYRRLLASIFMKLSAETIEKPVKKEVDVDARNMDSIHLQKMKPPSFSGNIRTFARFKADFKMIVESKYPDEVYQAYILKENCLHGDAKGL